MTEVVLNVCVSDDKSFKFKLNPKSKGWHFKNILIGIPVWPDDYRKEGSVVKTLLPPGKLKDMRRAVAKKSV